MSLGELEQEAKTYNRWKEGIRPFLQEILSTAVLNPPYFFLISGDLTELIIVASLMYHAFLRREGHPVEFYDQAAEHLRQAGREWALLREILYRWDNHPKPRSYTLFPSVPPLVPSTGEPGPTAGLGERQPVPGTGGIGSGLEEKEEWVKGKGLKVNEGEANEFSGRGVPGAGISDPDSPRQTPRSRGKESLRNQTRYLPSHLLSIATQSQGQDEDHRVQTRTHGEYLGPERLLADEGPEHQTSQRYGSSVSQKTNQRSSLPIGQLHPHRVYQRALSASRHPSLAGGPSTPLRAGLEEGRMVELAEIQRRSLIEVKKKVEDGFLIGPDAALGFVSKNGKVTQPGLALLASLAHRPVILFVRSKEQRELLLPFVPEENHSRIQILSPETPHIDLATAADRLRDDFRLRGSIYYIAGSDREIIHAMGISTITIRKFFKGIGEHLSGLGLQIKEEKAFIRSWRDATEILHSA